MRIIVCGTRTFNDYALMEEKLDRILMSVKKVIIVHGGAKGADKLAWRYAREHLLTQEIYHAEWNKHGKSAGIKRNAEMAEVGDACVAFWDGDSPGTKDMVERAQKKGMPVRVVRYDLQED